MVTATWPSCVRTGLSDRARRECSPDLDSLTRLRLLAGAYGVGPDQASELVDVIFTECAQAIGHIRGEVAAGNPLGRIWQQSHVEERAAADDAWFGLHRSALAEAIRGGPGCRPSGPA